MCRSFEKEVGMRLFVQHVLGGSCSGDRSENMRRCKNYPGPHTPEYEQSSEEKMGRWEREQ